MSTDLHLPPLDQLPQAAKDMAVQATHAAKEAAQRGYDAAKDAAQRGLDATKDAAQHASQAAKDIYQSAATRAEDTLVQSKQYVRENPLPVVLGAFTLGLTLGCMLGLSHHHQEPTLRERFHW
ncbi:MAG: YqjD family protein [Prosthecobacter sp.]|uniref:DUF883 family protein n=1 Tax=Prosthecobacter sp. TaxID=1965333 RepID=UPI003901BBF0